MYGIIGPEWRILKPSMDIGEIVKIKESMRSTINPVFGINAGSDDSTFYFEGATAGVHVTNNSDLWGMYPEQTYIIEDIYLTPDKLVPGQSILTDPSPYTAIIRPVGPVPEGVTKLRKYMVPYIALEKAITPLYYDIDEVCYKVAKIPNK